ncbi:putative RNA pseudouridylate synthase [Trypanosoma grayi]|uniref:putative RNA pseudouridylate synthase n=1 Tax=Trypanosoma grayi TaxID=71804 RepID=UPI0004F4931A|nr:putative RNA pseudouridylate synthase [Trypanosoma grayi]KEG14654.1 putative RNA pseudouridylate synthase [Trypanosoma grayi]
MGRRIRYSRPKSSPPETLLDFLCTRFSYLSRDAWQQHISAGHLSVTSKDGVSTSAAYVLRQSDEIHFDPPRELEPEVDEHIDVVHDDEAILVCVKNGNLPVAEGGRYSSNTLVGVLQRCSTAAVASASASDSAIPITATTTTTTSKGTEERKRRRSSEEHAAGASAAPLAYHPVHRLDKETSGLVVLAKQATAARLLSTQFEQQSERLTASVLQLADAAGGQLGSAAVDALVEGAKSVTKSYIAVLAGAAPEGAVFVVCDRIGLLSEGAEPGASEHAKLQKLKMACFPASVQENPRRLGRAACSRIRILRSDAALGVSVACVDILTGRTHQIRLHCAQLGFPVLGDKLYETATPGVVGGCRAVADDTYLARVRGGVYMISAAAPRLRVRRHLLHAAVLAFRHPISGERLEFFADPREWLLRDVTEVDDEAADVASTAGKRSNTNTLVELRQLLDKVMDARSVSAAHLSQSLPPL